MANIVFLGNFEVPYSSENHHVKSLEALGHTVEKLQERVATGEQILDRAYFHSDLFIWVHTHGWQTPGRYKMGDVLGKLKGAGIPTMTYHLDLWLGLERQRDLETDSFYKSIGHFFTADKLMADWFNANTEVEGHFIPAGVFGEECYIHPAYNGEFDQDVIFVGSKRYHHEYPYRPQLIDFLRETYGKRFLHVGGDGDTGTIRGDALNRIYAKSKVAIGDSLNINFNYPYYTSDRLFESTGRGGFTIYPRIEGLEDYFTDDEVAFYPHGNLEELKIQIDFFLENNTLREYMRLNGHNRTKKEHTYVHRWATILEELGIE